MAFDPTPEQKNAIDVRGTALVSAAAGSGKTAVLTERVISRLLDDADPIDADRLLVVTFTNAAAAEMKSRIEKRLSEESAKDPHNPRIQRQQLLMSGASVTTIDSFCIALVKENFDRLNVPPDFKAAAEDATGPVSDRVITAIMDEEFERFDEVFEALINALGADMGETRLREAILKIYDYSSSMPFPEKWRRECAAAYKSAAEGGSIAETKWGRILLDDISAAVAEVLPELVGLLALTEGEPVISDAYKATVEYLYDTARNISELSAAYDWDGVRDCAAHFACPKPSTIRKKDAPPSLEGYKARFAACKKQAEELCKLVLKRLPGSAQDSAGMISRCAPVVEKLLELTDRYDREFSAELLKNNLMTFSEAEHLALSLFIDEDGRPAEGSEQLKDRYREVLVDEYQDTNKLQDSLFYAISGGENLFMVGDVKQSIYRFRHADPDGFLEKKDSFAPYCEGGESPQKIILGRNFRSRKSICDFVNLCFESLMTIDTCGMDYGEEERLIHGADFPENGGGDISAVMLSYDKKAYSKAEAEALYIAEYIKNIMNSGDAVRDETDKTRLRPARYGDFAILMRSVSGKADIYCDTLRRCGIPVSSPEGNFFSSREVTTFFSLLKTIANPARDIPLLSVMLSPIFTFTCNEIADIRSAHRDCKLYEAVMLSAEENSKTADMLDRLEKYRAKAASQPLDKFILYLLDDTGYLNCAAAMNDGLRRRNNLLMLADLAASLSDGGVMGLTEYVSRLERLEKSGALKTGTQASGGDSVKIMTIHSSKGLQFPICILAGCSGKLNNSDSVSSLLISEDLGLGLKLCDDAAGLRFTTAAREAISLIADRKSTAEELRLLYVALTRAEEKLLIILSESGGFDSVMEKAEQGISFGMDSVSIKPSAILSANNYAKWFYLLFAMHPEYKGAIERGSAEFAGISLKIAEPSDSMYIDTDSQTVKPVADDNMKEEIKHRFSYKYPYKALNDIVAKTGASRLAEEESADDYSFTALPAFVSGGGLTPAQRGTAAHKFLQYACFTESVDPAAELERIMTVGGLSEKEGASINLKSMQKFFDSEVYGRILRSQRVMREVRFLDEIPASYFDPDLPEEVRGEPVIIQGIADCIFEEDGKLVILDYKTDRVDSMEALAERYRRQLQIYAAVCEKTYGLPVKECVIYSLRLGREITV